MFLLILSLLLVVCICFLDLKYNFEYILLFICISIPIIEFFSFSKHLRIEDDVYKMQKTIEECVNEKFETYMNKNLRRDTNSQQSFKYYPHDNAKDELVY